MNDQKTETELVASLDSFIGWWARQYSLSFDLDDADGLAQEGRIDAVKYARTWKADGGMSFYGWAHRNVRRAILRAAMARANIVRVPSLRFFDTPNFTIEADAPVVTEEGAGATWGDLHLGEDEEVTTAMHQRDRAAVVAAVLAELPSRDEELLRRRFFEGATFAEIAKAKGVSRQAIEVSVKRLLKRMREGYSHRLAEVV